MTRKYSLEELDSMREDIHRMMYSGFSIRPVLPDEDKKVEERLRTYMMNGTDPEELTRKAHEVVSARIERERERYERFHHMSPTEERVISSFIQRNNERIRKALRGKLGCL